MTNLRILLYFLLGCAIGGTISMSYAAATWATGDTSAMKFTWCAYAAVIQESGGGCGTFSQASQDGAYGACGTARNGGGWSGPPYFVDQNEYQGHVSCSGNTGSAQAGKCLGHSPQLPCPDGVEVIQRYRACRFGTNAGVWAVYSAASAVCPVDPGTPPDDPCKKKAGQAYSSGYYALGTDASASFPNVACAAGCSVTFSGECPAAVSLIAGVPNFYCKGNFAFDGGGCSVSDAPPGTTTKPGDSCPSGQSIDAGPPKSCVATPPDPCPSGQERVGGTCTPIPCPSGYTRNATTGNCGPTPPEPPDPEDPPPAGGNPGGGSGTPPPDKPPPTNPVPKTYCEEHPTDPMCAPSSFADQCPPTQASCKGDAVQCAQALAAKQIACDYEPNAKAWTELRTTIGSAYTPQNYSESMTIPYDVSKLINTADMDSAGGCPDDIHFEAMGGSFSIPMAPYCTMAGYVKFFLLFAAMVIAMRIFAS